MDEANEDFIVIKQGSLIYFDANRNITAVEFRGVVTLLVTEEAGADVITATANWDFIHRFHKP